ncbi:MAG: 16S rRNA (uracil(1498)-N(3))-methyltransferase [Clostridia bacterium]|nr:16S rRNA (uracil(1498)-N(3))-methyltransferase [Clostridia bacterium]
MHCFYIEPPENGTAALKRDEAKHAAKVLRLRHGDIVCAMDGAGGRWDAEITRVDAGGVAVRLHKALPDNEPPVRVTVYQGIPKAEKLDFIAQKLTELGAAALIPVKMERCVVKLDDRDGKKRRDRLERVALEAAKQCQRARAAEISEPVTWKQAIAHMRRHDLVLAPWEDARGWRMKDAYADHPEARDIGIVIGPEGGMSEDEVRAMQDIDALTVTLGPRILRTETAAVVSAALAMQLWGDL